MEQMTGGDLIIRCLKQENVKYVFGIPGDQLYPILDAIYKEELIDFVTFRHEQSSANAADAWARVTGQPGVCLGTVGPGAANLIPGVYSAFADSIPMVVITAQNQTWNIYPDHGMTQGLDQVSLFKPITKWQAVLSHWKRIPELVHWAFRAAVSGKPGPVLLDAPSNVLFESHDISELPQGDLSPSQYRCLTNPMGSRKLIEKAADLILQSENPLIHVGGGVLRAKASFEIQQLAEHLQCPVTTSIGARGVLPEDHPLLLLPAGYGALAAQAGADLVLLVGGRLGDLDFWGLPPAWGDADTQKLIQIDICPESIGLNRQVELGIVGDAKSTVAELFRMIKSQIEPREAHEALAECFLTQEVWLADFLDQGKSDQVPIHPLRAIKEVRDFFPREAITIVDGGNTGVWAHYLNRVYEPNTFLWPCDSGHLGVGIGYAIGAQLAKPDKKVYAIMGDGSFMFNVQELETARRLELPIVIIVANDQAYGMIKAGQKLAYKQRYIGVDFFDVRYDKLAQSVDCFGIRVTQPGDIKSALEKTTNLEIPAVIDIVVDREINLEPPDFETLAGVWLEGCNLPE
ncbi:MAG: thiamine pyrophosphate-binding protein [Candidatus Heimdallarchaeota archaeon]|nr:MAG: thiamine pyrophosphate-binding protein [Candidatus Heimdallarchaeota archaeon]